MGAKRKRLTPAWLRSVGAMLDEGVRARARCPACDQMFVVDLEAIACVKGRGFSLIGQHPRCKVVGCKGTVRFLYSPGAATPFRPFPEPGDP